MRATVIRLKIRSQRQPAVQSVSHRAQVALAVGLGLLCLFGVGSPPAGTTAPRSPALRIDPNRASAQELRLLPGVGPQLANNIIRFREQSVMPAFRTPADLDHVPRIGPATVARLAPFLVFPSEVAVADAGDAP